MVAAAILIQLSWPLVTGLINIVTQLSWGLEGLMYLPFGGRSALSISKSLEAAGGGGSLFVLLTGGALWTFAGAPGLMALIIAVLFALLTAFVTLIVRQVLMIALVLTAPLAIVAWILPNTEKFWKMWWGTFSKLLLMYPLILLILAGGRIGAHLLSNTDNNEVMTQIMVIIMFFAPFFLIPKTFSFAGGALAMVGGAIAARGSKLSGAANKRAWGKQAQKMGARKEKFQAGGYGSDRNRFTRGVRRAGQMSGQSWTTGFGLTKKGRASMGLGASQNANELLKDGRFVDATYDDGARLALQYGSEKAARAAFNRGEFGSTSADDFEKSLSKAKAVGYNANTQLAAIKAEASNKGRNYKGLAGIDALNSRIDAVAAATGMNAEDLRNEVTYGMRTQGGRFDLGALDTSIDPSTGWQKTAADQALAGWRKGNLYQHATQGTEHSFDTVAEAAQSVGGETLAVFKEETKQVHQNGTGSVADKAYAFDHDGGVEASVQAYYDSGGFASGGTPIYEESYVPDGAGGFKKTKTQTGTTLTKSNEAAAKSKARVFERPNPNDET